MKDPIVAVFMVTYNHADYIEQAISSVINQETHFPFKLFIGEDCSEDGTQGICLRYQKENPERICLFLNKDNLGAKKNAERVYKACLDSGAKYIAMLEGDDYWTDSFKLEKQVEFLESNHDYSICFHNAEVVNSENKILRQYNNFETCSDFTISDLIKKNFISTASAMFRTENIKLIPENFPEIISGDWAIFLLNAKKGKIHYFNQCMSCYRQHDRGLWSSLSNREMILKGAEVMRQLDQMLDYEYHEEFIIAIEERLKNLENADVQYQKFSIKKSIVTALKKAKEVIYLKENFKETNIE